jgi:benzoate membrane transport protein
VQPARIPAIAVLVERFTLLHASNSWLNRSWIHCSAKTFASLGSSCGGTFDIVVVLSVIVRVLRDFSPSTITAGFVASLVGLTSSIAIVFSAARVLGANDAELTSWVWAICIGMGVGSIAGSLWLKKPFMVAYSTPGAAILATMKPGEFTMAQGVGAFILCALAITVVGFSGIFEKLMDRIPVALASALLAGALASFALKGFVDAKTAPWITAITTLTYFFMRWLAPRYAVMAVLVVGVITAVVTNRFKTDELRWSVAKPIYTAPTFSLSALVSIAIPLFIVTMAGQNLPGVAAIRNAKFDIPISKAVGTTGVITMVLAPFGAYALNLSAITAAICMEPASHENPDRRYTAAVSNGSFYLLAGIFGTSITGALKAFPPELVHMIAALALLPTIGINLANATRDESRREPAMLTFLVTLSGVTVAKIGAPFWGVVAGVLATIILSPRFARR